MVNHNFDDNRGNKTRKVEGNQDLDPDGVIFNYLSWDGDKTLKEILIHVNKSGLKYSKQGLIKKLKVLSRSSKKLSSSPKKILRKIAVKGSYPIYRAIDPTKLKIQSDSYAFKDHVGSLILDSYVTDEELKQIKPYHNNRQQKIISNLIFKYGLVSLYTLLASYRRGISPKRNNKQNETNHKLWLKNALSFETNLESAKFSNILNTGLLKLFISKGKKVNEIPEQDIVNEVKNLEDVFSKMFTDFKEQFDQCENMINDQDNKFMRDVCFKRPEMLLS